MDRVFCRWVVFPLAGLMLLLGACEREKTAPGTEKEQPATGQQKPATEMADREKEAAKMEMHAEQSRGLTATLKPTEGNRATGTVTFTSENGSVRIVADVEGLEPGKHGFHIHEKGDCSAPDASSAGGHYNPEGTSHGSPDDPADQRHAGDLGNLEAGPDGQAHYERLDEVIALEGEHGISGKAVVIHGGADDMESQPSGGAGPRVACGVIEEGDQERESEAAPVSGDGGR